MPQASDDFRQEWRDDGDAEAYLWTLGIEAEKGMFWNLPKDPKALPEKAWKAIKYLCDEWDFATGERP